MWYTTNYLGFITVVFQFIFSGENSGIGWLLLYFLLVFSDFLLALFAVALFTLLIVIGTGVGIGSSSVVAFLFSY